MSLMFGFRKIFEVVMNYDFWNFWEIEFKLLNGKDVDIDVDISDDKKNGNVF